MNPLQLPPPIPPGSGISVRETINQMLRALGALTRISSPDHEIRLSPTGLSIKNLRRIKTSRTTDTADVMAPFTIYQYTPDPETPAASDWRTVRVHRGFVNDKHPDNDDGEPSPLNIVVAENSTEYRVWLEITLATDWTVASVTLNHGTTLPDQVELSACDDAPVDPLILLIGTVTTGDDDDDPQVLTTNQVLTENQTIGSQAILHSITYEAGTLYYIQLRQLIRNGSPWIATDPTTPDTTCKIAIVETEPSAIGTC